MRMKAAAEPAGAHRRTRPSSGGDDVSTRIHVVVDEAEKERFRRRAARRGMTLSAWLREAARERLERERRVTLDTLEALGDFFDACDGREGGEEPDWEEHRRVIERSAASGAAGRWTA